MGIYFVTTRRNVLLDKRTVAQLVKNFPPLIIIIPPKQGDHSNGYLETIVTNQN